ncbi:hypothetical protein MNB_SUP05-SYMBIONT-5-643 [hydrothermal vent metagenome]|uniref:Uncharacterized protein n=1 Tax=hydrothermal vent metagenome TaxID=652676 RepID=A0A1W1E1T4_9ZZZZ
MKDGVLMIIHIYPQGRLRTAKVSKCNTRKGLSCGSVGYMS